MRSIKEIFKKSRSLEDGIFFDSLQKILGFSPNKLDIYKKAFIHSSSNRVDSEGIPMNYERLEFLGDAMLSAVIASYLFNKAPLGDEGYLTKMRSKIVSRENLNKLGKELGLLEFVDSNIHGNQFGENIHGNVFEALVGAIYLDKGYQYCDIFIKNKLITNSINIEKLEEKITSYKSLIIEWCQKNKKAFHFEVFEDNGIGGERFFGVKFSIDSKQVSKARENSKKKAEEKAAKRAYFALQDKIEK